MFKKILAGLAVFGVVVLIVGIAYGLSCIPDFKMTTLTIYQRAFMVFLLSLMVPLVIAFLYIPVVWGGWLFGGMAFYGLQGIYKVVLKRFMAIYKCIINNVFIIE